MIRIGLLFAVLLGGALAAHAQNLTVRSGEHDGYTRLVVQVPDDTDWVLRQRKNGAHLSVALDAAVFETGAVFGRLTTNRLTGLAQAGAGAALEMEFGCECVASAFLYQESMIVVDIAPGTVLPPLPIDLPPPLAAQDRGAPRQRQQNLDGLTWPPLNLNASGVQTQLSTRVLQGADRELLDLNIAEVGSRQSNPTYAQPTPRGIEANISVSSVLDELDGVLGVDVPQIVTQPACISDAELDFASWSDGRALPDQIAALRAGMFEEFDRPDDEYILDLAKLYAFYGFGAEAVQALRLMGAQPIETTWVTAIAHVVDRRASNYPSPFRGLQRCAGDVALWAVLVDAHLSPKADPDLIEQAFVRLPDHVRRNLGPDLSSIFVDAQHLEGARRILRSVDRVETRTRPGVAQANARVAEAEGDTARSEVILTEVIAAPDAALEAPLALARLIEKRWSDRGAVSPKELELAAAYALEYRRSDVGPMMTRAYTVALGLSQDFDTALAQITALPADKDHTAALNRHLHLLAERADDITFLRQSLTMPKDMTGAIELDAALALADRLATLGFAQPALALANRPQDSLKRAQRARLRARAAILNNRPRQALLELSDDTSQAAQALRIKALKASDDFAKAGATSLDLGDVATANRFFWQADMIEKVDLTAGGPHAQLGATAMALSNAPARLSETPLADAKNLLTDSAETRQRIQDMLNLTQPASP